MGSSDEETLFQVIQRVTATLTDTAGMSEATATHLADCISDQLRSELGGQRVYIHCRDRDKKKRIILADWRNGKPIKEIVATHKVSRQWVYKVIADS